IPSLFQRVMTDLFRDLPFVTPYIDNLGFASSSWEEHYSHAKLILERLNQANLKVKPSSVNLGNTQIKLLGHVISIDGIGMDPDKRDMMLNWPRPTTGTELASFLGLGVYLRDHIRNYPDISAPLTAIKSKSTGPINWTPYS